MKYKIKKRKVYKKLIAQKFYPIQDCLDNDYLGIILGNTLFFICVFFLFIPCSIISLFQLNKYLKKIQNDIDNRPEYIKNWLHLRLVEKVVEK